MKLINTFEPFFQSLRDLPFYARLAATELIISDRDGDLSVCYVTESLFDFIKLVGDVPEHIRNAPTERYFVDLESIGTDRVRMYIESDSDNEELLGYYVNNNRIYESKRYKRNPDGGLLIDRYNQANAKISSDEGEISGDRSLWTGPAAIADAAENMGGSWSVVYLAKTDKPQSYIRITK